uniref:Retrovirus-related Pol polyprotein from transposon TNT 1-94-like beta-barrel domain-containing protein n=1 Tax=Peronospora matthiolae TaxID=2874970 RepID=A0AAV1UQ91_9STRA
MMESGASRHLVLNSMVLYDWTACYNLERFTLPDSSTLRVKKHDKFNLRVMVDQKNVRIDPSDVCYVPHLAINLISLVTLELRGCRLGDNKQAKSAQPKKYSRRDAPINVFGSVNCSDSKGPILLMEKKKNRLLINIVDHKISCVRVFMEKTKDQAAKMFEHFFVSSRGS